MVSIHSGSRHNSNPYSSNRESGWKISAIPAKTLALLTFVLAVWFLGIVVIVTEDPTIKKEVLDDVHREEKLLQRTLRKDKLRARAWIDKEKRWLRDKLDPDNGRSKITASDEGEKLHPWDLTPLEDLALRTGPYDAQIHVVFSTDCGPYQHWQAYQFFLSALRVNQPGRVTQIASGCKKEQMRGVKEWHDVHVAPMSFRFGLHLTPEFASVKDSSGEETGESYEFFNKPFGLLHWLEHGDGMGVDENGLPFKHDTIIALLDPDQMLLKPITGHFASPEDIFRGGSMAVGSGENKDSLLSQENQPEFVVRHGHPLSQEYGFRAAWMKHAKVVGDSPATKVTEIEALRSYAVGPPYLATALDMHSIATKWCEFVPKVHHEFPSLMAEMYAFSIASAHLKLPHQLMASMMVSQTDENSGEGWAMIDAIPGEDVCTFAMTSLSAEEHQLPSVMHFCHRYGVGDTAFFGKKKLPTDFFSCESPLLEDPPRDIGSGRYLYKKPPFLDEKKELSAVVEKREAFVVCAAIGMLNEYALYFKQRHCGSDANLKKEISLHDLPED